MKCPGCIVSQAMIKFPPAVSLSLAVILCLQGCGPAAQDTFLQIQMCVIDQNGVAQFKDTMRAIARSESLRFVDGSAETKTELKAIGAKVGHNPELSINVGIDDTSGHNFALGGNLGLPAYQVALGFGDGFDKAKAHRLSERLVNAFSRQWHVERVPVGQGVQPMKSCEG